MCCIEICLSPIYCELQAHPHVVDEQPGYAGGAGASVGAGAHLEVFTTRPDTLFGATYLVVAPEHALLGALASGSQRAAVGAYVAAAAAKSDLERTELQKRKTGVFTGALEGARALSGTAALAGAHATCDL